MSSAPIIYKEAALPFVPAAKAIGAKAMPWLKSNVGRWAPKLVGGAKSTTPFLANPHLAMPAAGAGIGAYSSLKSQSKAIQEGRQDKFSWGQLGTRAGIGAGIGLGASAIKPVGKVWNKAWSTKALTPAQSEAFLAKNPTYLRQWGPNRPKLLSKAYFKNLGTDLAHPIKSFKSFGLNVPYKMKTVDGVTQVMRRSPAGMAATGALWVGMPAMNMYQTAKDKTMSPTEKAVRIGTSAYSYATPLMLPSMAMWSAPDLVWKKKQQEQQAAEGYNERAD
jgi:hypothetical protein